MADVRLKIDDQEVVVPEGTTILKAAEKAGRKIPTLCYLEGLSPWGGCRLCVVEVKGSPKLLPSCVTPVSEGMEVITDSDRLREARRFVMDLLMSERNHFCMYCERSGRYGQSDCELQMRAYEHGMDHFEFPVYVDRYPVDASSPVMVMDHNRCILCGRCIRACAECSSNYTLGYSYRGHKAMIACDEMVPRGKSTCVECGACVQACPTGALFGKFNAYKGKKATSQRVSTACPLCGVGCETEVFVQGNNVVAIEGVGMRSGSPDRGQLCRLGRFGVLAETRRRPHKALLRDEKGRFVESSLEEAIRALSDGLLKHAGKIDVKVSSSLPIEDLEALLELGRRVGFNSLSTFDEAVGRRFNAEGFPRASLSDLLEAERVVIVDLPDLVHRAGVVASFVRKAVQERRSGLITFASEETKMDKWAYLVFRHEPQRREEALKALESALSLDEKGLEEALKKAGLSGLDPQDVFNFVGTAQDGRWVFVLGHDVLERPEAISRWEQVSTLVGGKIFVVSPASNSRYVWDRGLGFASDGQGEALFVVLSDYDFSYDLSKLGNLSAYRSIFVYSPYVDPCFKVADVVLPGVNYLEMEGTYVGYDGKRVKTSRVLRALGDARPLRDLVGLLLGEMA